MVGGGGIYVTKKPKSTLLADNTQRLITTKQTKAMICKIEWVWRGASFRFEKRPNFSINPRKLPIFYPSFSNPSEALGNMASTRQSPSLHLLPFTSQPRQDNWTANDDAKGGSAMDANGSFVDLNSSVSSLDSLGAFEREARDADRLWALKKGRGDK